VGEGKIPSIPEGNQGYNGNEWEQNHRITQNHRMVGVGRDLCGSSSPTLNLPQKEDEGRIFFSFTKLDKRSTV